ncbi:MAG TPA: patatin-like phospholipase family protein, partial [Chthoniobacteraceae bacterium]|nr:patatin-like phospholipase family protein [Chthoniobacteraceae bacterium]
MPSRWSRLTIVLVSIFACAPQTRSETARPKIGLVLSGGAARAAAHVGVLKALEELRVPVDCIAGTSMGGVVGGLYASGMSPDEIESWFGRVDWRELFSDQAPRYPSLYSTKERDFDLNQNVELSISAKKGLKFPSGFIAGQNLLVTLRELLLPVREVHDFDQLRIPFRAVATDIETGDKIVLSRGDLVGALRATMSVPAVFTPYKIGDRLLIDGGVSSNLPIDAAREMGADRIIAVDVHAALKKESELDTITAVADQLLEIVTQKDTRAQIATLGAGDLYIYLKMERASLSDFDRVAQNIDEGYRETMKRASALRAFAVSDAEYASFLVRQRLARENSVQISFLKMDTPAGPGRHELRRPIPFTPGDPLAFAQLEEPFAGAETLRREEVVDFKVINEDGRTGLLLTTRKRRKGPHYFNFGLDFAYSSSGETDANLLFSIRMTELNALGAEWRTFASIGDSTRVFTELLQPIDRERRIFLAPGLIFGSEFIEGEN